jgi:hypothetical protein
MPALCSPFPIDRSIRMRWLLVIALAKVFWCAVFILQRNNEWPQEFIVGDVALYPTESQGYYKPMETLLTKGYYNGMCRMPGLLPFYFPLRLFLPETIAQMCMIPLQVLFDILATAALGILAARIFQSIRALHITYALACISTFTAVRNNFLLSDSLCISVLILSLYSFSNYLILQRTSSLMLTAIGLCIALFLRPAMLVMVPAVAFLIVISQGLTRRSLSMCLLLLLPSVLALSAWTLRNQITFGRTVVLLAPLGECQPQITPDFAAIRGWIMASGGDYQPWAAGGESYWFFDSPAERAMPFEADDFAAGYDSTTLLNLKSDYHLLHSGKLTSADSILLEQSIIERSEFCREAYIREHPVKYYLLNKLHFARMILFPGRIDDLPFPAFDRMNLFQKAVKIGSYLAIPLLSIVSLLASAFWLYRRKWNYMLWMCIPMGMVLEHAFIGFVEQRYLATAYPFFLMAIAGFIATIFDTRKSNPAFDRSVSSS